MSPKEKSRQLIDRFYFSLPNNGMINSGEYSINNRWNEAKMCALIAVDEILQVGLFTFEDKKYWEEVKQEIDKL